MHTWTTLLNFKTKESKKGTNGRNYPGFKTAYKDEEEIIGFCQQQLAIKQIRADYEELIRVSHTWGQDKNTIVPTYNAIGRSIINYAASIWSLQLSDTH